MGGGALPERLVAAQRAPHAGVAQQSDDGSALREAKGAIIRPVVPHVLDDEAQRVLQLLCELVGRGRRAIHLLPRPAAAGAINARLALERRIDADELEPERVEA